MTRYGGTKALDAEIKIDFTNNTVSMDYSSVRGQARYNSNDGIVLMDEWESAPARYKLKKLLLCFALFGIKNLGLFAAYSMYFTTLVNNGVIKSANGHYDHQRLLRWFYTNLYGENETEVSGELKESKLVVHIDSNLCFDYVLDGEYREKIRTISLVRNYSTFKKFGVYREVRQNGWNVVFEFSDPPKNGKCVVTCVA